MKILKHITKLFIGFFWIKQDQPVVGEYIPHPDDDLSPVEDWVYTISLIIVMFAGVMLWMAVGAGG